MAARPHRCRARREVRQGERVRALRARLQDRFTLTAVGDTEWRTAWAIRLPAGVESFRIGGGGPAGSGGSDGGPDGGPNGGPTGCTATTTGACCGLQAPRGGVHGWSGICRGGCGVGGGAHARANRTAAATSARHQRLMAAYRHRYQGWRTEVPAARPTSPPRPLVP